MGEVERGLGAMRMIHSARFEISIDGVPRTYRDQKEFALLAAQILKSRNPNSVIRLKGLESGAEIVIAFKAAQRNAHAADRTARRSGSSSRIRLRRR